MYLKCQQWKLERIMVVDDEEFCIAAIRVMLKSAGIDVVNHVDYCING